MATALVTGASSGIGASVARALAQRGHRVAIAARRADRLNALASELRATGAEVLPIELDVRDVGAIDAAFEVIRTRWGGVEVLVNNAGLGRDAPLMSGDAEAWREMLEVNVLGLCVCTRNAVADMRGHGDRGHVIHISSMAGHRVPGGSGVYSATKYAVRSLTEGLRQELRHAQSDIRVTAISPGYVETEFAAVYHASESKAEATYARFPCLQPDDIARAVMFALESPEHMQVHDLLIRPTRQPT